MSVTQNWTRQAARHENSDDYSRPLQQWKQEIFLIYKKKMDVNNLEHLPTTILLCLEKTRQSWGKKKRNHQSLYLLNSPSTIPVLRQEPHQHE